MLSGYIAIVVAGGVGEWCLPSCRDVASYVVLAVLFALMFLMLMGVRIVPYRFNFPVHTGNRDLDLRIMRRFVDITNFCLMSVLVPILASAVTDDAWWIFIIFIFIAWQVSLFALMGSRKGRRR